MPSWITSCETRSIMDFTAVRIRSGFGYGSQHDTVADYYYCNLFNYLSMFYTCLIGVKTP